MNTNRVLTFLMGLGLALISVQDRLNHALWAVGFALVLFTTTVIITTRLREHKLTLGSKYVYIPLAVIVVSMLMSQSEWTSKLLGVSLLAIYIACVNLEGELKVLIPAVIIGSVSVIACNLWEGARTGGIYSYVNYNLAVGAIVMGTVLVKSKYQWILVTVALAGLLFTGAEEALVALAILGLAVLVRRDWSRKILLPVGALVLVLAVCVPTVLLSQLWGSTQIKTEALDDFGAVVTWRDVAWERALTTIRPLGHGYTPFYVRYESIHNVPLRILYEAGPTAALAWCFAIGYVLVKTKRKYIPVAVIALSLFDHFMWTQLCVYTFAAIGIAMRSNQGDDLIFKKERR